MKVTVSILRLAVRRRLGVTISRHAMPRSGDYDSATDKRTTACPAREADLKPTWLPFRPKPSGSKRPGRNDGAYRHTAITLNRL